MSRVSKAAIASRDSFTSPEETATDGKDFLARFLDFDEESIAELEGIYAVTVSGLMMGVVTPRIALTTLVMIGYKLREFEENG